MTGKLILIVDDDQEIRDALTAEIGAAGFRTMTARNGADGEEKARRFRPDLILTDLSMPETDGFHLIRTLRGELATPIIVLSVRGGDADKIRALDLGADDFVVKPFSIPELLARVRAQLRRVPSPAAPMKFSDLSIDPERRRVVQGGRDVRLTPTELAILNLLARNAGKPVLIEEIIREVWAAAPGTTNDTVRVHVGSLRRKIEPDPSRPRYIVTEPWVGYRFLEEPE